MKTLRLISQVALLSLGAICMTAVNAQELKIGFVNTDRIFREASTAKAAQVKLEQEFSKREKDLMDLGNALKNASSVSSFKFFKKSAVNNFWGLVSNSSILIWVMSFELMFVNTSA